MLDGLGSLGTRGRRTDNDEDFAECFSSNYSQTSPGDSPQGSASEPPAEMTVDEGKELQKSTQARNDLRDARRVELSVGDGEDLGVVRRREKSGVELAAAMAKSRASERR